jgi:hypothetical protein
LRRRDENKAPIAGASGPNSDLAMPAAIDWYAKIRR